MPHALLKNGHAMTIAAHFWLRRFALPRAEDRHFQVDADSRLLGHCHWQDGKRRARAPIGTGSWPRRLERFELHAGDRGKSLAARVSRSPHESAKLRRHGTFDADSL